MDIAELKKLKIAQLNDVAKKLGITSTSGMKKQELIFLQRIKTGKGIVQYQQFGFGCQY